MHTKSFKMKIGSKLLFVLLENWYQQEKKKEGEGTVFASHVISTGVFFCSLIDCNRYFPSYKVLIWFIQCLLFGILLFGQRRNPTCWLKYTYWKQFNFIFKMEKHIIYWLH